MNVQLVIALSRASCWFSESRWRSILSSRIISSCAIRYADSAAAAARRAACISASTVASSRRASSGTLAIASATVASSSDNACRVCPRLLQFGGFLLDPRSDEVSSHLPALLVAQAGSVPRAVANRPADPSKQQQCLLRQLEFGPSPPATGPNVRQFGAGDWRGPGPDDRGHPGWSPFRARRALIGRPRRRGRPPYEPVAVGFRRGRWGHRRPVGRPSGETIRRRRGVRPPISVRIECLQPLTHGRKFSNAMPVSIQIVR